MRDLKSKEYAGLVKQGPAGPLSKLIIDRTLKLSATLRSPKLLEVVVYGRHADANSIGDTLLEHNCFLQQPDSFDDSKMYFNPQCLFRKEEDAAPMWESTKEESGTRMASLTVGEKSKVTELLDSASGPIDFKAVRVSEMLQTALKE
jgi:hypothetical protein